MSEDEKRHVEVMDALRHLYAKVVEVEKKLDALAPKGQRVMKLAGKGAMKPPNPIHTLLIGRMVGAWAQVKGAKYDMAGRDIAAIRDLLRRGMPIDQLVARWTWAVKNGCDSIFSFEMNFNKWNPSEGSHRPQVTGTTDLYAEKT